MPSNLCVNHSVDRAPALKGSRICQSVQYAQGRLFLTPGSRTVSDNFSVSRHRLGNTC